MSEPKRVSHVTTGRNVRIVRYWDTAPPEMWEASDARVGALADAIIEHTRELISMPSPPPSEPGMPPGMVTGRLRRSFYARKVGLGHYQVGNSAPYAKRLELGSPPVAPRPFMVPGLLAFASHFSAIRLAGGEG